MVDDRIFSVNEVVAALGRLHGRTARVAGVLSLEFEGNCLSHTPAAERVHGYESSLWVEFDREAGGGPRAVEAFDGRYVVVTAVVDQAMRGHFDIRPGSPRIVSISKARDATVG